MAQEQICLVSDMGHLIPQIKSTTTTKTPSSRIGSSFCACTRFSLVSSAPAVVITVTSCLFRWLSCQGLSSFCCSSMKSCTRLRYSFASSSSSCVGGSRCLARDIPSAFPCFFPALCMRSNSKLCSSINHRKVIPLGFFMVEMYFNAPESV